MGDEATEFVAIMAMGRLNRYLIIVPIKNQSRTSQLDFFLNNLLSSPIKLAKPLGFLGKKTLSLSIVIAVVFCYFLHVFFLEFQIILYLYC
jgi:hypothetical protein